MTRSKYNVIISEDAKNMLASNIAFLAKVNPNAAIKQKKSIIDSILTLEEMPMRYPFFNAEYIQPNKYRKLVVNKLYIILYQVQDNIVYVDYILDCRKDYQWLLWFKVRKSFSLFLYPERTINEIKFWN